MNDGMLTHSGDDTKYIAALEAPANDIADFELRKRRHGSTRQKRQKTSRKTRERGKEWKSREK